MESRKRPHTDEEDLAVTKKRILTGSNGSPHVNGIAAEQDEPANNDNLELFRKEAIFRRMKHYSREHERSQSRITELERRKNTCEAGLAAMSACWTQLVETIRLLVKTEDLPPVKSNTDDVFDITVHLQDDSPPDLTLALENEMAVTRTLVTKFAQLSSDSRSKLLHDNAFMECQKAKTECAALRSQMDILRIKLQNSESQRDQYHDALVVAESRADRLKSGTVLAMQSRGGAEKQGAKGDETEEPQRKPSSPAASKSPVHGNGVHDSFESDVLREQLNSRESKIAELEKEAAVLRDEKTLLELQLKSPSPEQVTESPHYQILLQHSSLLEANATENRKEINRLTTELGQLQASRKEWEDGLTTATSQATQELKTMLAKRDAENARLRDQREQHAAELNERKHKDGVKFASIQEMQLLASSRSERILGLQSELNRLKARLAANAGDEDLMFFFAGGGTDSVAYIESLKNRVTAAENRAAAVEHTLSIFQDDNPNVVAHMKSEADALDKLSAVTAQLEKYQTVYGDPSVLPPDTSKLAERLREKETEIQKLRLSDTQRSQAEASLYAELDKLSAAWEALDRQVKSKVFDLAAMEDKLVKSGLDRAKSENKFYAAMRDKEAIETERKNIARNVEKQAKVVERLVDAEKNLIGQVSDLEKELVILRKVGEVLKEKLESLETERNEWKLRAEGERKKMTELRMITHDREKALETKRADLQQIEDGFLRSKKELERQSSRLKDMPSSTGSQKAGDMESSLMSLLKCSTCKQQFRNAVITKCRHTFCKPCLDTRISTRQRKCPACNLPFSQSDVQQIIFQ